VPEPEAVFSETLACKIGAILSLFKFGKDPFCQLFSQFHPPLVEAVDVPNDTLNEYLVFIKRNKGTQNSWRHLSKENRVGGAVSLKNLVGLELFNTTLVESLSQQLLLYLLLGFPPHESFCLSKKVGKQLTVVIPDWIVRYQGRQEIAGYYLGTLMYELVKGMLPVRTRFSPDDGARLIVHLTALAVDIFPIGFHVSLLKVCGKPV
jgi:hypothetical protein